MASLQYSTLDIIWISLFTLMLSIAILGNTLVIWIVLVHRRMRTVTNYFLLNLSVADLTMAIFNGAPNFFYMLRNDWILGEILCLVNNFVATFTVASCVFTMMAISIDRWIAVMRPLEPRMSKRCAWRVIFAIWISSALLASPALIFSKTIFYSEHAHHCMLIWPDGKTPDESIYDLSYNVCFLVITYVVPMTAMAVCYGSMSWELWGHTHIGEVTERQRNSMMSKRKVVRMFIIVVLSFAICWLPYHGYFIYMYLDKTIVIKSWAQPLYLSFFFLAMSTAMINPLVYYFMNSRFRGYIQETMKTFCCCKIHLEPRERGRRDNQQTPPLLRRGEQYNSQSCSRSRSDENKGSNEHHNHNQLHHHHYHHPRMNPHQEGLDDRVIPRSYRQPNRMMPKQDRHNRFPHSHNLHYHSNSHAHHHQLQHNNNGHGSPEILQVACGQDAGELQDLDEGARGVQGSSSIYNNNSVIGDLMKVNLLVNVNTHGAPVHRVARTGKDIGPRTRTTYC